MRKSQFKKLDKKQRYKIEKKIKDKNEKKSNLKVVTDFIKILFT
jgi:hypothetical protein